METFWGETAVLDLGRTEWFHGRRCRSTRSLGDGPCVPNCALGYRFCNGQCVLNSDMSCCPIGTTKCGTSCVDVLTDAANCNGCGVVCGGACGRGHCSRKLTRVGGQYRVINGMAYFTPCVTSSCFGSSSIIAFDVSDGGSSVFFSKTD